ncbi:MAG: tetratricopeptide repeat protein, partial [Eubacterium sp.]|nr:tetratricopeptide repeat protein [Eubacterium sp.]
MRETIVCIGKTGTKPYRFPQTEVSVSSYEELCCYLSQHMICYLYTLPDEDLLVYIKEELGLEKLYRQLVKYSSPEKDQMKYFAALFREGNYFSEAEIRTILDHYRSLKNEPYPRQYKQIGDLLLKYHKATMAIQYYDEALKHLHGEEGVQAGNIYHNRGIAHAQLFRFEDAKIDFVKAYRNNGDEASLFSYYCLMVFHDGDLSGATREIRDSFHVPDDL